MNAIVEKDRIVRQLRMRDEAVSKPFKSPTQAAKEAAPRAAVRLFALIAHFPPTPRVLRSKIPRSAPSHMPYLMAVLPRGLGVHLIGQREV